MCAMCTLFILFNGICGANPLFAQEQRDSVRIFFHQGKANIDLSLKKNNEEIEHLLKQSSLIKDTTLFNYNITITGWTSPEGGMQINNNLSKKRADAIIGHLLSKIQIPINRVDIYYNGSDWCRLLDCVRKDTNVPYHSKTLKTLEQLIDLDESQKYERFEELKYYGGGKPYTYIYYNIFPLLRSTVVQLTREKKPHTFLPDTEYIPARAIPYVPITDKHDGRDSIFLPTIAKKKPVGFAVKTNLAYDAILIPNIGIEVNLAQRWSIGLNWMYAWWKTDLKHIYWRTYGGDIEIRHWFGNKATQKAMTGHHIGLYGQIITYDFELGGRGYLGDKWSYGAGVSYGYSFPLSRHFNIDLSLGLGYLTGIYKEYLPIDDHYVWQKTRQLHWFGPTKAEISLVWLIGNHNINIKKGDTK